MKIETPNSSRAQDNLITPNKALNCSKVFAVAFAPSAAASADSDVVAVKSPSAILRQLGAFCGTDWQIGYSLPEPCLCLRHSHPAHPAESRSKAIDLNFFFSQPPQALRPESVTFQ